MCRAGTQVLGSSVGIRYIGTQVHRYVGTYIHTYVGTLVRRYAGQVRRFMMCAVVCICIRNLTSPGEANSLWLLQRHPNGTQCNMYIQILYVVVVSCLGVLQ